MFQGSKNAFEEQGQLGVGARARFRGVPHFRHPHAGQLLGDPVGNIGEAADPEVLALHLLSVASDIILP